LKRFYESSFPSCHRYRSCPFSSARELPLSRSFFPFFDPFFGCPFLSTGFFLCLAVGPYCPTGLAVSFFHYSLRNSPLFSWIGFSFVGGPPRGGKRLCTTHCCLFPPSETLRPNPGTRRLSFTLPRPTNFFKRDGCQPGLVCPLSSVLTADRRASGAGQICIINISPL